MNTTPVTKKSLVAEVERLAALPGNWDGKGGVPASPRATGHYKWFLDLVPHLNKKYSPGVENDGSIRVSWRGYLGRKEATFTIVFGSRGNMILSTSVDGVPYENNFSTLDEEALQAFVYAAN